MHDSIIQSMPPIEAKRQLRDCLENGSIIPTYHFREELSNECIPVEDAWQVLRYGNIYDGAEEDDRTSEWKYRVEGHEPGGKWIVVVFCFKSADTACLITVFSVNAKRRKK